MLSSSSPRAGLIACAFQGARRTLTFVDAAPEDLRPTHVGQRVVDAVLERHGVASDLHVQCDCSAEELEDPRWQIPLATSALVALRDHATGLAEVLYLEDILDTLQECDVIQKHVDIHRVHAALYGGFHAQLTRDGHTMNFHTPEAAMIWLQLPHHVPPSAWTKAQNSTLSYKRHAGTAERLTKTLLRALTNDDFAIFEAFEQVQPPEALLTTIPGWIPARNTTKSRYKNTIFALEGRGPDMLIVSSTEDEAMSAALLAKQRLEAHSFHATVHAWSTLPETL